MWNYPDKLKIVNWNSFGVTSKKRTIFTHFINFTGFFDRSVTLNGGCAYFRTALIRSFTVLTGNASLCVPKEVISRLYGN